MWSSRLHCGSGPKSTLAVVHSRCAVNSRVPRVCTYSTLGECAPVIMQRNSLAGLVWAASTEYRRSAPSGRAANQRAGYRRRSNLGTLPTPPSKQCTQRVYGNLSSPVQPASPTYPVLTNGSYYFRPSSTCIRRRRERYF